MRVIRGLLLACLGCASACGSGGSGESFDVASSPLAGKVGGKAWTFVAGEASSLFADDDTFFTDLYADPIPNACQNGPSSPQNHLIFNVPMKPGDYELSFGLTATFVIEGESTTTDNLAATRGRLVVDAITDSSVRGKAHVIYDADNEVDGTFEVTRCP